MLRQTSLATLGLSLGSVLTIVGFAAYFADNATLNLIGFFYGFPLLLGGLALKANELKPIPFTQPTPPNVLELRKEQATLTQNKLRKDLTRYTYGQDTHFDRPLAQLGLSPSDEKRPTIVGLRETEVDSAYALVLEFESPDVPLEVWQEKHAKMEKFFGPGVRVELTQKEASRIDLTLITTLQ
ncbi:MULTISPECIES: DUF2854 domain-containing protein [Aerosakkonema]|uniref:DUF2854 domain-containing protein n=1 Tax=Aerosakkonema TaxID=1246629 RepID=UPI0035B80782